MVLVSVSAAGISGSIIRNGSDITGPLPGRRSVKDVFYPERKTHYP